ncbi:16936_t:CDS:2, partial [Rhizophagus irregularis]
MDSDKDTERCKRARSLHDRYKKISKTGERPDYRVSREWKKMCEKDIAGPFINHNPTFTGNPLMGNTGSIHGGSFFNVSKRDKEEDQKEKTKRTKIEHYVSDETQDEQQPFENVNNDNKLTLVPSDDEQYHQSDGYTTPSRNTMAKDLIAELPSVAERQNKIHIDIDIDNNPFLEE